MKGTNQIRGWPKPEALYAAVRVQGMLSVSSFFRSIIAATPHPQDVIDQVLRCISQMMKYY